MANDGTVKIGTDLDDSGFKSGLSKLGSVASGALKGTAAIIGGVATAATGAVAGLLKLESATEEYRIAQGKLNTAFQAAGYSAEDAQGVYKDFYEILGDTDTATEASQLLAKLSNSQEDFSKWTKIAAGVNGTFGDSLPIEGLIEAANETAKVGTVTGTLADALNWAGISEDEFNSKLAECSDESDRNRLIMETLAGTYDEASDAFYRNNESLISARDAQVQMDEALSQLGTTVSDVKGRLLSEFVPALSDAAAGLSGIISGAEGAEEEFSQAIEELISSASELLPDFLEFGGEIIASIIQGIADNLPEILATLPDVAGEVISALGSIFDIDIDASAVSDGIDEIAEKFQELLPIIASATAAFVTYKTAMAISSIIDSVRKATEGMTIAQAALNAVMNANPFVLIATAIVGLVSGLIVLWNTNEEFREAVTEIWESIKSLFIGAWEAIKSVWDTVQPYFTAIWEGIQAVWSTVSEFFVSIWNNIILPLAPLGEAIIGAFSSAWSLIQTIWNLASPYFLAIWEAIKSVFSVVSSVLGTFFSTAWSVISTIWSVAVGFFSGVWAGIRSVFSVVASVLGGFFSTAWSTIQFVWNAATGFFTQIWNTISGIFSVVESVLSGDFSGAWEAIQEVFSGWGEFFTGIWEDLTGIFSGAWDVFTGIGSDIVEGIKSGISGAWATLSNWVSEKFNGLVSGVKSFLGINSPSKLFRDQIGKNIGLGVAEGIVDTGDDVANAAKNLTKEIEAAIPSAEITARVANSSMTPTAANVQTVYVQSKTDESQKNIDLLQRAVDALELYLPDFARMNLVLDTGATVGQIAPQMNKALGKMQGRRVR